MPWVNQLTRIGLTTYLAVEFRNLSYRDIGGVWLSVRRSFSMRCGVTGETILVSLISPSDTDKAKSKMTLVEHEINRKDLSGLD